MASLRPEKREGGAVSMIAFTVAGVGAAVAALTWGVTVGADYLPGLYSSSVTRQTLAANYTNIILGLWYATALVVLIPSQTHDSRPCG